MAAPMAHFLLYQLLPLAALWLAFAALGRLPSFRRRGVPAVFAAGALLQLLFWLRAHPDLENPDSLGFFRLGHGLETDLRTILFRPKLYPLFLGLFHSLRAAAFFQCLLKLGMAGFLIRFARLCGWKPVTTAFVLFLFLFNSLWLSEPLRIFDTTLFAFLFSAFLWLAAENLADSAYAPGRHPGHKFTALCLTAGLTALTRQAADLSLALALAMVAAVILYRAVVGYAEPRRTGRGISGAPDARIPDANPRTGFRDALRGIMLSLAAGAMLAGSAAVCNGVKYGVWHRSVALGINLYTHAAYYQLHDPAAREWGFVERYLPGARLQYPAWETGFTYDMPWAVNALPHRLERKMGTADAKEILENDRAMRSRALAWALGNPGRYLASFANEAARLLMKCEELYPASLLDPGQGGAEALRRAERGVIHQPLLLLLLAGAGAVALCRRNRVFLLVPWLAAASYLALVAAVQIGLTRYALPGYLPLLLAAGQAVDCLPLPRKWASEAAKNADS
jgi:hypothetical protein